MAYTERQEDIGHHPNRKSAPANIAVIRVLNQHDPKAAVRSVAIVATRLLSRPLRPFKMA